MTAWATCAMSAPSTPMRISWTPTPTAWATPATAARSPPTESRPTPTPPRELLTLLKNYHFPGNVRELKSTFEYAFVTCQRLMIQPRDLPPDITRMPVAVPSAINAGRTKDELKKRLAYSTVSQVSYIALGAGILGPVATIGGIVHLVHQGLMKITLFFAAGNYAETLGIHKVSEMNGVGRRMPATTLAFSVAALGMIGGALSLTQVPIEDETLLKLLAFNLPPLMLLAFFFGFDDLPSIELPRLPRALKQGSWLVRVNS